MLVADLTPDDHQLPVTDELNHLLSACLPQPQPQQLVDADTLVGLLCVSGPDDESTCILLNYLTVYLAWLSDPSLDQQMTRWQQQLFLTSKPRPPPYPATHVSLYRHPFAIPIRIPGSDRQHKSPVFLLSLLTGSQDTMDGRLAVSLSFTRIDSPSTFAHHVSQVYRDLLKEPPAPQRVLLLRSLRATTELRDRRSLAVDFASRHVVLLPPSLNSSFKGQSAGCYLRDLVFHLFGDVCSSRYSSLMRPVAADLKLHLWDPEVEAIAQAFTEQVAARLNVDPFMPLTSLRQLLSRLHQEALTAVRELPAASQVNLVRRDLMAKRLSSCAERMLHRLGPMQAARREAIGAEAVFRYTSDIQKQILPRIESIGEATLRQLHHRISEASMADVTRLASTSNQVEDRINVLEVRHKIDGIFSRLQGNWLSVRLRKQEHVNSLIRQLETQFAEAMRANLEHVQQISGADVESRFSSISSRFLRQLESSCRHLPPDVQKSASKRLESVMKDRKNEVMQEREKQIQQLRKQVNDAAAAYEEQLMAQVCQQPEMDHPAFKELCAQVEQKVTAGLLAAVLAGVRDKVKESETLWQKLQPRKKELTALVDLLIVSYRKEMAVWLESDRLVSQAQFQKAHRDAMRSRMNQFSWSRQARSIHQQLVMHFEQALKQEIEAVYQELQSLAKVFLQEKVQQSMEKHLKEFEDSMKSHFAVRSPKSVADLKRQYSWRQPIWMQRFENQQMIKESDERDKLVAQLKEAMESRFTQWEAPLAHQLAIEEAFNTAYAHFSSDMSSCLDARKQMQKLTADKVAHVFADCQQNALVLLDLKLPEDLEQKAKNALLQQLCERTAADLDKFTRRYVHDEPGLGGWFKSPIKTLQSKLWKEKQPLAPLPPTYAEATKGYSVQGSPHRVSYLVMRGDSSASSSPPVSARTRSRDSALLFTGNGSLPSAEPGNQCSGSVGGGAAAARVAEETGGAAAAAAGRASPLRSRNRRGVDSTPKDR